MPRLQRVCAGWSARAPRRLPARLLADATTHPLRSCTTSSAGSPARPLRWKRRAWCPSRRLPCREVVTWRTTASRAGTRVRSPAQRKSRAQPRGAAAAAATVVWCSASLRASSAEKCANSAACAAMHACTRVARQPPRQASTRAPKPLPHAPASPGTAPRSRCPSPPPLSARSSRRLRGCARSGVSRAVASAGAARAPRGAPVTNAPPQLLFFSSDTQGQSSASFTFASTAASWPGGTGERTGAARTSPERDAPPPASASSTATHATRARLPQQLGGGRVRRSRLHAGAASRRAAREAQRDSARRSSCKPRARRASAAAAARLTDASARLQCPWRAGRARAAKPSRQRDPLGAHERGITRRP